MAGALLGLERSLKKTIMTIDNRSTLRKFTKIGGAIAFSFLSFSLVACQPELDNVDAEVETPTDQSAVPEGAEVGGGTIDISELVGETVTVSTKVTEVLSPNLFTVFDAESMRGEEVLAVTNLPAPEVGTNVELTGDVEELDVAAVDQAYNIEVDPALVEAYTGKPYIAVQAIEAVD